MRTWPPTTPTSPLAWKGRDFLILSLSRNSWLTHNESIKIQTFLSSQHPAPRGPPESVGVAVAATTPSSKSADLIYIIFEFQKFLMPHISARGLCCELRVFGLEILQEPEEPGLVEAGDQKGPRERGPEKRLKSLKDPSVFFGGLRASGVRKRLEVFFLLFSFRPPKCTPVGTWTERYK